jgi:single-strand DNA-binding protein
MDLNKVELIGCLATDPDVRAADAPTPRVSMRVAVNRPAKAASGATERHADYIPVVTFGQLAKVAQKYLKKGDRVYVDGRLSLSVWSGTDGQKRSRTEIVARNLIMLGRPKRQKEATNDAVVVEEAETDTNGEG